jgi:hypothetical protein
MIFLIHISGKLYSVSTGWVTLVGVIVFLLFIALVLPAQTVEADQTSQDAGSPDMSFFYTAQDIYGMAEAYGEAGRVAYIRARFTFDLIWPLVYTFFLTTSISWLMGSASMTESRFSWLNLTPVLGMLFDYLENISTSLVMARYPATTDTLAALAPFMTAAKWIFVYGSFVVLFISVITKIWQSIRNRLGNTP